ncbi:MAG: DUF4197 domain-containing protein [Rubrivivax sp.]|nr:DUF4197 domain-containing protein [Rubrivivax sp.]
MHHACPDHPDVPGRPGRPGRPARRSFLRTGLLAPALAALLVTGRAQALSLAQLSDADAGSGLKLALTRGAEAAVDLLGRNDGFLGNPRVRIPLPGYLEDAAKLLRTFGQGKRVDELVTTMNRAAEQAVPLAKDLLVDAVKTMSVSDAKGIITGGQTSVTDFFAQKTRAPLAERFLPVVTQATENVGLAKSYDRFAGKAASLGLLKKQDADLAHYVTGKTLDGLFLMIGEEEKKIRRDPIATGSELLKKVFGASR